jgi:chromosomal replication initiation ATPase DnaA
LGTDRFVEWIRREFLQRASADRREEPSRVRLQEGFTLESLSAAVGGAYEVDLEEMLRRRGPQREPRQVLMYLACQHTRGRTSLTALAERFSVSVSGLTAARDRLRVRIGKDRALRKRVTAIEKSLGIGQKRDTA